MYPFDNTGVLQATFDFFFIPISLFFVFVRLPQETQVNSPPPGAFPRVYPQVIHRLPGLSTGYPQVIPRLSPGYPHIPGLSTGYPQATVIHRLSTGLSTVYPHTYPQFPGWYVCMSMGPYRTPRSTGAHHYIDRHRKPQEATGSHRRPQVNTGRHR